MKNSPETKFIIIYPKKISYNKVSNEKYLQIFNETSERKHNINGQLKDKSKSDVTISSVAVSNPKRKSKVCVCTIIKYMYKIHHHHHPLTLTKPFVLLSEYRVKHETKCHRYEDKRHEAHVVTEDSQQQQEYRRDDKRILPHISCREQR